MADEDARLNIRPEIASGGVEWRNPGYDPQPSPSATNAVPQAMPGMGSVPSPPPAPGMTPQSTPVNTGNYGGAEAFDVWAAAYQQVPSVNYGGTTFSALADTQPYAWDRYNGASFIPDPAIRPGTITIPSPPPAPPQSPSGDSGLPSWFDTESSLSPYQQFRTRKQGVYDDLADEYALQDKGAAIGGKGFNKALEERYVEGGFAEAEIPETLGARWRKEMGGMGGAMGIGFTAMAVGSGVSQYIEQTQAGKYVSPEMVAASEQNAAAQGLGSLAGMGIGALFGPAGAMAGQFVGQSVGQVAGASAMASGERNTAERETAERLASVTGSAADAVDKFRSALEATGAPIQQLAQGIQTLMAAAPGGMSPVGVAGAGAVANALGSFYNEDTSNISRMLSRDPALYAVNQAYTSNQGSFTTGELNGIADYAVATGDFAGAQSARRDAARAGLTSNATYQNASRYVQRADMVTKAEAWVDRELGITSFDSGTAYNQNQAVVDAGQTAADTSAAKAAQQDAANYLTLGKSNLDVIESGQAFSNTQSRFALAQAGGAGASALRGFLPELQSAAQQGIAGDESAIAVHAGLIANLDAKDPKQLALIQSYREMDVKLGQDENQRRLTVAQARRETFMMGVGEEEAGYNLDIQRGAQGGLSAAEMRASVMGQVGYLRNVATDGSALDPTQRTQLQAEAANIAFQNAQQQYGQEEGGLAIGRAGTGVQLATAQTSGGPSEVYQARSRQIQDTIALEQQLQSEIDKGNLTYDQRQQKLAQIKDLTADVLRQTQAQREEFYDSSLNIEGGNLAGTAALDSRNIARGGNAAFDPALLTQARGRMATAQAALANAKTPEEQSKYFQEYGAAYETEQSLIDQQNTFRPSAQENVRDINARGEYQRSMELPYVSGPGSDPFRRGLDLIGNDQRLLRGLNANRSRLLASGQWRPEDEVTYAQQSNSYQNDIAGLEHDQLFSLERMLPSMLAGGLTGGAQVAVTPTAAMASRFLGMNSPLLGGWGASGSAVGTIPTMGGGPAANFTAASGGIGGDHTYDMVALLREIRDNTSRHAPGPPMPSGNILNQELSQTPSPITRR